MNTGHLKAIILVAGDGGRLLPISKKIPKSILLVGDKPLISYSISNLLTVGVSEFIFITGHKGDLIKQCVQELFPHVKSTFIHTNQYNKKNSIYSFYKSRSFIENSNFFRLAGDLLYTKGILETLLDSKRSIVSAVEKKQKKSTEDFCVKVDKETHTIIEYGKHIMPMQAYGVAQGIDFVSKDLSNEVIESLEQIIHKNITHEFPEYAFQNLIYKGQKIYYQDINTKDFWCDIDTQGDLQYANGIVQSERFIQ